MKKTHKSPGPAAYNLPDTFGTLAPPVSFGTSKRGSLDPAAAASPGPTIALKSCLGRHKDVTFGHAPIVGFGTSERMASSMSSRMPGPGEYKLPGAVGDHDPTKRTLPKFGFGTSGRLPGAPSEPKRLDAATQQQLARASGGRIGNQSSQADVVQALQQLQELGRAPGPGAYDAHAYRKKPVKGGSFGKAPQRDQPSKRQSRAPGPGQYGAPTTVGPKTAITSRKGPSVTFGTSRPGFSKFAVAPGPGEYKAPSAFGSQVQNRSLPSFRFGQTPRETGVYE